MKKLVVMDFGANVEESRLLNKLTELHFIKLIGTGNIHSVTFLGKDFDRDEGWKLVEELSSIDYKLNKDVAFAVVCEFPSRNILEWCESIKGCWGADRFRLYIRVTENMTIHPLNYKYETMDIEADVFLSDPDEYSKRLLIPKMFTRLNCFGEYDISIPKTFNITAADADEFSRVADGLKVISDLLQIAIEVKHINGPEIPVHVKDCMDEHLEHRVADDEETRNEQHGV